MSVILTIIAIGTIGYGVIMLLGLYLSRDYPTILDVAEARAMNRPVRELHRGRLLIVALVLLVLGAIALAAA